jgi:adenine-specific DNA-methyltransferase
MGARLAPTEAGSVGAFDGQLALKVPAEQVTTAIEPEGAEHGAVFTRRWVVELILDLAGYTADRPLDCLRAIEPACGHGAFLVPMAARLSEACKRSGKALREAEGAIRAFDLQPDSVALSREAVAETFADAGWPTAEALHFAESSIQQGDFLLREHACGEVDFVLGNPPYIRLEAVPPARGDAYRKACRTMAGRADIYVGFIEVGLKALRAEGTLAFICADRWMRNQYGRLLRDLVAHHFSFEAAIEMHDVDAFAEEVSAYPSIVVIRNRAQRPALVAKAQRDFSASHSTSLASWRDSAGPGEEKQTKAFRAAILSAWFPGNRPWPSSSPARLAVLRSLEQALPTLEDDATGTRVGIGVATGADSVFVTAEKAVAETDRLLPLAMAADTMSGELEWSGHYLANPWRSDGEGLVDLARFPRLSRYYQEHREQLLGRNVAKRRPNAWYRTIDRVDPELLSQHKLLLPDIKASMHPVLDRGQTYPHHNLYFVTSKCWDLEVLGGLLLSRVAQLFVEAYAVRMRGGYLRFQAQYLRRIRLPALADVDEGYCDRLRRAFRQRDVDTATDIALELYGLPELPG